MPEVIQNEFKNEQEIEILTFQNNLIELKKKLVVERQMFEAAKLIRVRMDKQTNVKQVENSLEESKDRISFLEEQVKDLETKIFESQLLKRKQSDSSEYVDAVESLKISPSTSTMTSTLTKAAAHQINLNYFTAGHKLTWPKIDFKINELSYRLKLNENILEAEEKLIEAFKGQTNIKNDLLEDKEITKQRVQVLNQALKKYTSLVTSGHASTPATPVTFEEASTIEESNHFTGKLLIKITKITGLTGGTPPPFALNFDLDQLANFRSGTRKSKVNKVILSNCSKDPDNQSAYNCYQETAINLIRSRELELTVSAGGGIKGMFFVKLATLFVSGPDVEGAVSNLFEIEPAGSVNLQFHYSKTILYAFNH